MIPDRWLMLLVLFGARTAMAYQFQTVGSVGPQLIDSLAIDFATIGTLIGLYMLPGFAFALPGGMLGQRFGAKSIVVLGLAMMTGGGALMSVESFSAVVTGRLISGIGAVVMNVMMSKMIADWFAKHELVTAMAVFIASWPFGLALGLLTFAPLAAAYSWVAVMWAGAISAFIGLALVAFVYRAPPDAQAPVAATTFRINLGGHELVAVILAGAIWGIYNVGYIVLISFLPELFLTRGYSSVEANQVVSFLGWILIPSVPLGGYLAERFGRPDLIMLGSLVVVAVAALALPFVTSPGLAFAGLLLFIGLPAGLIMALPAQVLRPASRSAGMGIFFTCYYVVMAVLPALAGVSRDVSGSPSAGALFAAGMMLLAGLLVLIFRSTQRPALEAP